MCGSPDIPEPDPRIGEATLRQIELAERAYNDYVGPGGDREYTRKLADETIGIFRGSGRRAQELQDYQLSNARFNDQRYRQVGIPFEDRLLRQVENMDTEQFREGQVRRSLADTQMQVDNARQQGIRTMTRRGVNPESGAFAAMMNDGGRAQALAMATAANKTRLAAQQVGLSNKMQMYGGMKGMAGLGATSAQLALGANAQTVGAGQAMMGSGATSVNANNQALGMRNAGMSAGISGYNGFYANQLTGARIAADTDAGSMMTGVLAGYGTSWLTGKLLRP